MTADVRLISLDELATDIRPDNVHAEQDWGEPKGKERW
jgi:antitoxin component of MazEF toxin-antitoxin module